jgi:hypothetical protein
MAVVVLVAVLVWRRRPSAVADRRWRADMAAWNRDQELALAWMRLCDAETGDPELRVAYVNR